MKTVFRNAAAAALLVAGYSGAAHADPTFLGPTPYVGASSSPFDPAGFTYFHLETFEDHLLNTPGVAASAGGVTSVVFGPSIHDSVDADDGVIDGSGLLGDSFFAGNGSAGVQFTFSEATLGSLPTSAGIVWTDGGGATSVTFSAFGPGGVPLLTQTVSGFADGSNNGETGEDRFLGVVNSAGISAIFISNASGGMEVDHLQYGGARVPAIPEPQTYALMLAGLASLGFVARRRKHRG